MTEGHKGNVEINLYKEDVNVHYKKNCDNNEFNKYLINIGDITRKNNLIEKKKNYKSKYDIITTDSISTTTEEFSYPYRLEGKTDSKDTSRILDEVEYEGLYRNLTSDEGKLMIVGRSENQKSGCNGCSSEGTLDGRNTKRSNLGNGVVKKGALSGERNGVLNGALNGALSGALKGELNGALNGALSGALKGELNGTLNGALSGALKGELNCTLNGALSGALKGELNDTQNDSLNRAGNNQCSPFRGTESVPTRTKKAERLRNPDDKYMNPFSHNKMIKGNESILMKKNEMSKGNEDQCDNYAPMKSSTTKNNSGYPKIVRLKEYVNNFYNKDIENNNHLMKKNSTHLMEFQRENGNSIRSHVYRPYLPNQKSHVNSKNLMHALNGINITNVGGISKNHHTGGNYSRINVSANQSLLNYMNRCGNKNNINLVYIKNQGRFKYPGNMEYGSSNILTNGGITASETAIIHGSTASSVEKISNVVIANGGVAVKGGIIPTVCGSAIFKGNGNNMKIMKGMDIEKLGGNLNNVSINSVRNMESLRSISCLRNMGNMRNVSNLRGLKDVAQSLNLNGAENFRNVKNSNNLISQNSLVSQNSSIHQNGLNNLNSLTFPNNSIYHSGLQINTNSEVKKLRGSTTAMSEHHEIIPSLGNLKNPTTLLDGNTNYIPKDEGKRKQMNLNSTDLKIPIFVHSTHTKNSTDNTSIRLNSSALLHRNYLSCGNHAFIDSHKESANRINRNGNMMMAISPDRDFSRSTQGGSNNHTVVPNLESTRFDMKIENNGGNINGNMIPYLSGSYTSICTSRGNSRSNRSSRNNRNNRNSRNSRNSRSREFPSFTCKGGMINNIKDSNKSINSRMGRGGMPILKELSRGERGGIGPYNKKINEEHCKMLKNIVQRRNLINYKYMNSWMSNLENRNKRDMRTSCCSSFRRNSRHKPFEMLGKEKKVLFERIKETNKIMNSNKKKVISTNYEIKTFLLNTIKAIGIVLTKWKLKDFGMYFWFHIKCIEKETDLKFYIKIFNSLFEIITGKGIYYQSNDINNLVNVFKEFIIYDCKNIFKKSLKILNKYAKKNSPDFSIFHNDENVLNINKSLLLGCEEVYSNPNSNNDETSLGKKRDSDEKSSNNFFGVLFNSLKQNHDSFEKIGLDKLYLSNIFANFNELNYSEIFHLFLRK
ncbi:hypothetical protein, conserved [Plasmodium gonderi]|uniref:Uncharacterized protein n=1 Tax=Plasmodium gonderi TaxID=77519 RepID=A0A1Y1JCY8_PLAGO|nr:hypothetical protein, conserved [Plasmodium gonderi]GAW79548.1 hypothetical protein, conserved [Plasmodium gonderi]